MSQQKNQIKEPKKPLFVPTTVKNKQKVYKSFSESQEEKWIPVTKERLKRWEEKNQEFIILAKNKIRFKIMELDEEKFVPITSGWITGTVIEIDNTSQNQLIKMENVEKSVGGSKPIFEKSYQLPFFNMQ